MRLSAGWVFEKRASFFASPMIFVVDWNLLGPSLAFAVQRDPELIWEQGGH